MKKEILVIGRNPEIMQTVLRLINAQPEYQALGALTDSEALNLFSSNSFDLVLIGGGVAEDSEKKLSLSFKSKNKNIKIIRHYGGGSGLLFNELQEAFTQNEK